MTKRKIRVLYVEAAEDGTVGGSHQALYDLACGLHTDRYEPVVLFYQYNSFVQRLEDLGIETCVYSETRERELEILSSGGTFSRLVQPPAMIFRRLSVLRDRNIDLLHIINSPLVGCDDWLPACRLAGIPAVASCMGIIHRPENRIRQYLLRQYDRVLPVSRFIEDITLEAGIPPARTTTIHHGIDLAALRGQVRRSPEDVRDDLGVPASSVLVAMVGNLRHWKGQHVLLEALGELEPSYRDRLKVVFAGSAGSRNRDYQEKLDRLVRELELSDRVSFLGYRDDVPELLNAADIVVHASVEPEPGGIIVLEAMAVGAAVIASSLGGHTEALTDECGMLFDPRRPEELAEKLTVLIRRPELREALGVSAFERIEEFSLEHNVAKTEAVYESVLNGRGRKSGVEIHSAAEDQECSPDSVSVSG